MHTDHRFLSRRFVLATKQILSWTWKWILIIREIEILIKIKRFDSTNISGVMPDSISNTVIAMENRPSE